MYIYGPFSFVICSRGGPNSTFIISPQILHTCSLSQVGFLAIVRTQPGRHTADMSAAPRSKHVCYVTQQTFLLCDPADISAV